MSVVKKKTNSLVTEIMNEKLYVRDCSVCSSDRPCEGEQKCLCEEYISFDHYSLLNTLWRLSFVHGTRFTLALEDLRGAFKKSTPEYNITPITNQRFESLLKYLQQKKLLSYDLVHHQITVTLFYKPFMRCHE